MQYPKSLPPHGTIGFVAPSFGCDKEPYRIAFEYAMQRFRRKGFRTDPGPNCYVGEGIGISNTPDRCGRELTEYYLKKDNDCLISCGGGELMCEILDYVDFDAIAQASPKWYMGFSDNTNFTYLLTTLCDTASIYGPLAVDFGRERWHLSLNDALGLLTGEKYEVSGYPKWEKESLRDKAHPLAPLHVTEKRILRKVPNTDLAFSGRLLGGCMDCLVNLLGTRFDRTTEFLERYRDDGIIWFLESCDLNVFAIRRAMWQMEHAGWFEHVTGFLIGRPLCFGQEMMGLDQYDAVLEVAARHQVPVALDVDLGHLPPAMPLITGSVGHVSVSGNDISIRMELR